jgi:hypothetical protein
MCKRDIGRGVESSPALASCTAEHMKAHRNHTDFARLGGAFPPIRII